MLCTLSYIQYIDNISLIYISKKVLLIIGLLSIFIAAFCAPLDFLTYNIYYFSLLCDAHSSLSSGADGVPFPAFL